MSTGRVGDGERRSSHTSRSQACPSRLDEHDLNPGERILNVVNDSIRLHDKILLCCSDGDSAEDGRGSARGAGAEALER